MYLPFLDGPVAIPRLRLHHECPTPLHLTKLSIRYQPGCPWTHPEVVKQPSCLGGEKSWLFQLTGPGTTRRSFRFLGYGWGGTITFLALVHMLNATQLVWGGGDDNIPCTCTHVECYATGHQLVWGGGGRMLNATQLVINWSGVGGDDNVPCTCTHVECYATGLGWGGW